MTTDSDHRWPGRRAIRVLLLEALTIGSLHFAAVGSLPDGAASAQRRSRRRWPQSLGDPWHIAMADALRGYGHVRRRRPRHVDAAAALCRSTRSGDSATTPPRRCSRSASARSPSCAATSPAPRRRWLRRSRSTTTAGFRSATVLRAVLCWLTGRNGETRTVARSSASEVVALAHQPFNPVIRAQALFALGAAETLGRHDRTTAAEHLRRGAGDPSNGSG